MGNKRETESYFDDDSFDISESLKRQVNEMTEDNNMGSTQRQPEKKKKKKKHTGLKIFLTLFVLLIGTGVFLIFTRSGNKVLVKMAASYIASEVDHEENSETDEPIAWVDGEIEGRKEEYVTNILLIGIEEFGGAKNTDSMMIASINSKTGTVQLSSLMRDSYVKVPGWKKTKLNAAFAHGGIELLKKTIEENYLIHLDGFASVNFSAFEEIIDYLGGVEIQLGASEAQYLNTTNYISKRENRNVKEGMNLLNGNQALGFCRVRKKPTYDGVNNDFGRTLRQRRVLNAIFDKYKSQNVFKLISTTSKCLSYVTTSLSQKQIEQLLNVMIENNITTMDSMQVPVEGHYESPKSYEGVTWPIVLDWDANILEMYKSIYGDTEEEASMNLATMKNN